MGTAYTVKLAGLPGRLVEQALRADIERILHRIDARMSIYREDSELARFNAARTTGWFSVSAETERVITEAVRIAVLSDGAFDVTVGPLVNLWGFGRDGRAVAPPSDAAIRAALTRVGYRQLQTRPDPPAVRKRRADVVVDLGGIAKGYAVDALAEHFEKAGATNYLVDIGGDLKGGGHNAVRQSWTVGIEEPSNGRQALRRLVQLRNVAIATSGNYRNYFEHAGRRYSHIIDPRNGRPITHGLVSASVIAPSAMYADAMATAIMVLGPEAGYALAQREGIAAYLVMRQGEGFSELATPAFQRYIVR